MLEQTNNNHLMNNYAPLPVSFSHGSGARLWDEQGNEYLDALSGIAVCNLGHSHPAVTQAIQQQAEKLLHCSNVYQIDLQQKLAQQLTRLAGMDKVFFCNSGAEANEAAIKMARLHGHHQDIAMPHVVVMSHAFHGRTLNTLTATGNSKIQQGFEPLVQGFIRINYNDIEQLKALATRTDIAAVLLEPIQGEGGLTVADNPFLATIRQLCDENNWLMMLDEIQTGVSRTGRFLAYQHSDITPDIISMAKGLGNGVPIGACLAKGKAAELFTPGSHGTTFGGNPLACSAALAVLEQVEKNNLSAHVELIADRMFSNLKETLADVPGVIDIRGKGLMLGIELDRPCAELVKTALIEHKILINVTASNVIRLLPPLIINQKEADEIVARVSKLIKQFLSN
ncbi:acetylornithine transaminase [Pelagibaculum spongiae]|uniref:Acetylornithine aminotransferase n=1 Tax=Pelagibaculum spongiae TaxID=2080658 RepID=A0A2V1GQY2_9GAMM|nr:acetylornithine transaminase [Pelagibaculum spongiae]PVZ62969.1 acetylornithine transaminase [Pelagibaculum spongiae]